jgi:membrane fusion protein, multidrug efflux system
VKAYDRVQEQLLDTGKLITIDNQIDTTTGTVKLRAVFDNANGALFANQFVNTRLLLDTQHDQVLIPDAAIQHNGDTSFVYLLQNGKAVMHEVKPGASDNGLTAVLGLEPGAVIADSSFEKLQDGTDITTSNALSPASGQGNAQ